MPTDDIDKMTGPELSAAVAREVMGWKAGPHYWYSVTGDLHNGRGSIDFAKWRPHTDRNDAHRVLKRCEELDIVEDVIGEIGMMIDTDTLEVVGPTWSMLTIDPTVICRAALRAVRER